MRCENGGMGVNRGEQGGEWVNNLFCCLIENLLVIEFSRRICSSRALSTDSTRIGDNSSQYEADTSMIVQFTQHFRYTFVQSLGLNDGTWYFNC